MSEILAETSKGTGQTVSAGAVSSLSFSEFNKQAEIPETPANTDEQGNAENKKEDNKEEVEIKDIAKTPELTDDQLKELLKLRGIEVNGTFEEIKNKLNPTIEATEEEKKKIEVEKELLAQSIYIKNGGTLEQFAAIKSIANADEKELSQLSLRKELKEAGLDDSEIDEAIKQRYFQIELENIEQEFEESDEDFAKRKLKMEKLAKYGSSKMEGRGKMEKEKANRTLSNLYKAIETSDLQKREMEKEENELLSKVDEISKNAPRKITLQLGKADGSDAVIAPIEFEVKDEDIAEVAAELRNSETRNNILYTTDNKLNLQSLFELKLQNKLLNKQLLAVYHESASRQTEVFKSVFPHAPSQLGFGSQAKNTNGQKGKFVSAGEVELVRRS